MVNININSAEKIVEGVEKVIATSLNEFDETLLPFLHQRLSYRLRALSDEIGLAENYLMDAEQQLANLIGISFSDLELSEVSQLAKMVLDLRRNFRRTKSTSAGEPSGTEGSQDVDEQAFPGVSLDGPLSTPRTRSPRIGSPSPLGNNSSLKPSTPVPQSGLATPTGITHPGADDASPETAQNAENVQARVFELQHHALDGDPKMSLDQASCPEFGSKALDNEDPLPPTNSPEPSNSNRVASMPKRRKTTKKLSRSQSALTGAALPDSDPPILRKPKPRGQLSTEIFTTSDGIVPLFNTPLSHQRPSPNQLAIAGMIVAVAELDRLSLMADASPLGFFAARQLPSAPSNTPSGPPGPPPATPTPPERSAQEAPAVVKGEKQGPPSTPASMSADFASFPAFVRTPSPMARPSPLQMSRSRPPQGFLPLLSGPPKAGEVGGTSSSEPTSLMAGGHTHAAVGKPDTEVAAGGGEPGGGDAVRARSLMEAGGRGEVVGLDGGSGVGDKEEKANTMPAVGELEGMGKEMKK